MPVPDTAQPEADAAVPQHLRCPICHLIMTDPVLTACCKNGFCSVRVARK
jgi:hypothetical protein